VKNPDIIDKNAYAEYGYLKEIIRADIVASATICILLPFIC
jgi:hypothetical protein